MENFSKAFKRNADGSWTCLTAATLDGPGGRIQVTPGITFIPGMTFMNADLTKWLDEYAQAGVAPAGYRTPAGKTR
jgi:hypothetical protein